MVSFYLIKKALYQKTRYQLLEMDISDYILIKYFGFFSCSKHQPLKKKITVDLLAFIIVFTVFPQRILQQ